MLLETDSTVLHFLAEITLILALFPNAALDQAVVGLWKRVRV